MSGIVGFISNKENVDTLSVLKRMLTRIKHRGTNFNLVISQNVGLGNAEILSNSQHNGKSLHSNIDKSRWIVWSGRIFNHEELTLSLLRLGCVFQTRSDAELALHLFERFGAKCLSMINGQFAFCVWDAKKNEMFLARDRIGVCPLYYTIINDGLVFASEIKAVFEYPELIPKISTTALTQIVTFWTTITPNTIFEGIRELSPGHYLTFNYSGLKVTSYWGFPVFEPQEYSSLNLFESIEQFSEVFSDAVNIRVDADSSYGAYLSGGLDSSVTTAYIKKLYPDINLDTFSISFTDKRFDETHYQNLAVDYYNTNHSRIICNDEDIAVNLLNVIWHAETPLLRTAPIPMFLLSKLANKSNIKTVITGEGADEILGGYNIFKESIIREFWSRESTSKYRPLLLKKLYPYLTQLGNANQINLNMFFGYKLTETSSPIYSHLLRWNNTSRIKNLFSADFRQEIKDYNPIEELSEKLKVKLNNIDLLSRAQYLEASIFTSGYLLSAQGERMAMANSVEGRYPFLDHRVIEMCMKMKPEYKLKGLNEKYLLKILMKDKMPKEILIRPKQPYRAPVSTSLLSDNLYKYNSDFMSEKSIKSNGFFDFNKVSQLLSRMKSTSNITEIDKMALSAILSTQILNSLYIDKTFPTLNNSDLIELDKIYYHNNSNFT